ncbi:hypothetical protein KCP78_02405 [Salmonella enterica subsp. enterica]|nr:hypothetical protein KCP78_02405 [Salmonella enterica subsp. enterica]
MHDSWLNRLDAASCCSIAVGIDVVVIHIIRRYILKSGRQGNLIRHLPPSSRPLLDALEIPAAKLLRRFGKGRGYGRVKAK